jgi:hypothetical protein
VADRDVLWIAPHAGNLNGNAGANSSDIGTIANLSTQAELVKFMQAGGRMALAGNDVAFTLAQNNPASSNDLLRQFRVKYESDADFDITHVYQFDRLSLSSVDSGGLNGLNPIPYAMWEVHYTGEKEPTNITLAPPFDLDLSTTARATNRLNDGAPTNFRVDSITGVNTGQPGGAYPFYAYDNTQDNNGNAESKVRIGAIMSHAPYPGTNTSPRKSVFYAFGLEGVDRQYTAPLTDGDFGNATHAHAHNPLALIFHNTIDWLTTTSLQGRVFITNNVANPKDVLVYAVDDWNAEAHGRVMATALTDAEGDYVLDGLDSSIYLIYAYKTGFTMQHDVRNDADSILVGGVNNITLIPAQPGSLSGTVRDKDTKKPLPGVPVTATDIQNTVTVTVTTDANGVYTFPVLPAGLYVITTPNLTQQAPDGKNYAASTNVNNPVSVLTGTNPPYNIDLETAVVPPKPSTVTVTVLDASSGTNEPAVGATVTLVDSATNQVATTLDGSANPGTTDGDGKAVFQVVGGQYVVTVNYGTYKAQSQTIIAQPDETNPDGTNVQFIFGGILHTFTGGKILMTSAPYEYGGLTTGMTFDQVLGIPDQNSLKAAIVAFEAKSQTFTFYPTFPADTFHLGRGYGFKLPTDGKVLEQGTPAPNGATYIVRAEVGWNLIASPYPDIASWAAAGANGRNVKFALRDDPQQTLHNVDDTTDPVTLSNILSPLWGPSLTDENGNGVYSGAYAPAVTVMQPWQSYWVKVAQPTLFYFARPAVTGASPSMLARASVAAQRAAAPQLLMPRADVWGVNVTASTGDLVDRGLALGIARNATSGSDAGLDFAKPGPMSASAPSLSTGFPRGNGNVDATDVRGPGANTWTFNVSSNVPNETVTLTWTATGALPAGSTATLVDLTTGQRVNLGAATHYAYRSKSGGSKRAFRVEVR